MYDWTGERNSSETSAFETQLSLELLIHLINLKYKLSLVSKKAEKELFSDIIDCVLFWFLSY